MQRKKRYQQREYEANRSHRVLKNDHLLDDIKLPISRHRSHVTHLRIEELEVGKHMCFSNACTSIHTHSAGFADSVCVMISYFNLLRYYISHVITFGTTSHI